jgi:hypothetical protein
MDSNPLFDRWYENDFFGIGDDDTRRDLLLKAVADVVKIFKKSPPQVRCYALVALDAHIAEDNSLLIATYEVVKKHWPGAGGKFKGTMPRQTVRGIILSALYERAAEDLTALKTLYYTASGYYHFVDFGSEQPIIKMLLEKFGDELEAQAIEEWSVKQGTSTAKIGTFKLSGSKLGSAEVDEEDLKISMTSAVQGLQPTNSSYGASQVAASWFTNFGDKSAAGIASVVEAAVQKFGESVGAESLEKEVNTFFGSVATAITEALTQSHQSLKAVERRSQLLWWKETLYSTTLRESYRDMDAALLPAVMAAELVKLLPNTIPVSVDFLLTDTYRAVVGGKPEPQKLADLVASFADDKNRAALRKALPTEMTACTERTTLTAFLTQVLHQHTTPDQLQARTGLRPDHPAAPDQLAVILLHDLLTDRLLTAR